MGRIGLNGTYLLNSAEETLAFGKCLAQQIDPNQILALNGDLGAGKTTFVQGLAQGLEIKEPIQSPTFTFLNLYQGLCHFDLYRLKNSLDFLNLGFDEYFQNSGICAIEWAERIESLLPPGTLLLHFRHIDQKRSVTLSIKGEP